MISFEIYSRIRHLHVDKGLKPNTTQIWLSNLALAAVREPLKVGNF